MVMCAVVGCTIRSDRKYEQPKRFFSIPAVLKHQGDMTEKLSTDRRLLWLSRIDRPDLTVEHVDKIKTSKVCNRHFVSGKPSALYDSSSADWAPSLHLGLDDSKKRRKAESNEKRTKRRKCEKAFTFSDFVALALENSEHESPTDLANVLNVTLSDHDYTSLRIHEVDTTPVKSDCDDHEIDVREEVVEDMEVEVTTEQSVVAKDCFGNVTYCQIH